MGIRVGQVRDGAGDASHLGGNDVDWPSGWQGKFLLSPAPNALEGPSTSSNARSEVSTISGLKQPWSALNGMRFGIAQNYTRPDKADTTHNALDDPLYNTAQGIRMIGEILEMNVAIDTTAAPRETSARVRMPIGLPARSRLSPMRMPTTTAAAERSTMSISSESINSPPVMC
jgi:hypothetical protein